MSGIDSGRRLGYVWQGRLSLVTVGGKMMNKLIAKLKNEEANSLVENVIILPLIFIIIYAMILTCFIVHDRSTLDAAAKRGAIYAAHCISDPNYATILEKSGNKKGTLDTSINITQENAQFSFTGVGRNIQPYRYITSSSANIGENVKSEVENIVNNTRIPWRELDVDDIQYSCTNKVFYQDITVTLKANYPIPKFFAAFGMETDYEYTVSAKMTVNDPDEFIRNADMVVDLIVDIDSATGGNLEKAKNKISDIASKIVDWLKI